MICPEFFDDIVDDLIPFLHAEIHINIGEGDPLRIEKTLKNKPVADGIHIGNLERIGHEAPRGRASSRTNGYSVFSGIADNIPDD